MKYAPFLSILGALLAAGVLRAANTTTNDDAYAPHTPTLIFHPCLSGLLTKQISDF